MQLKTIKFWNNPDVKISYFSRIDSRVVLIFETFLYYLIDYINNQISLPQESLDSTTDID